MTTTDTGEMRKLTALLLNDFEVHAMGCADIKKTVAKGKVQNRFNFRAVNEHDAVYELYSDQIDESVGDGEGFMYATEEEAITAYAGSIRFFPCCKLEWGGTPVKAKSTAKSTADRDVKAAVLRQRKAKDDAKTQSAKLTKGEYDVDAKYVANGNGKLTREQKQQLAHAILTAADCVMDQLDGVGLKDVSQDVAAKTVAQWLHHLPVDHEWYVTSMKYLPKPDRSDWR
jgi:hypothetical protein